MWGESIGKNLRERRLELSLTQREVANSVGVTEATVSRWESGEIDNMRRDKIANLARVLKISPLLIMGMSGKENKPSSGKFTANDDEIRLLYEYRKLNDEDKRFVKTLIARLIPS